jgi:hypothetical protein
MAVNAMNVTAGPEGLVPALLVFGTLPNLPHTNSVNKLIAYEGCMLQKQSM